MEEKEADHIEEVSPVSGGNDFQASQEKHQADVAPVVAETRHPADTEVPQREYNPEPGRFRDPYGRVEPPLADIEVDKDYFLDPADGKRVKLVVQQGEECLFDSTTEFPRTWSAPEQMHEKSILDSLATFLKQTSLLIWAVYFVFEPFPNFVAPTSTEDTELGNTQQTVSETQPTPTEHIVLKWWQFYKDKTFQAVCNVVARWLGICVLMVFLLLDPRPVEGKIRQNGYYDPVRYRDWWYPKSARNPQEQETKERSRDQSKSANGSTSSTAPLDPSNGASDSKEVHDLPTTASESLSTEKHPTATADTSKDAPGSADPAKPKDIYDGRHLGPRYLCFRQNYVPNDIQEEEKSTDGNIDNNSGPHATIYHRSTGSFLKTPPSSHQSHHVPSSTKEAKTSSEEDNKSHHGDEGYKTQKVEDWLDPEQGKISAEYVFVSYTREQFYVEEPAGGWNRKGTETPYTDSERKRIAKQVNVDKEHLIKLGLEAARKAKVPAFWIDFECLKSNDSTRAGEAQTPQQATSPAVGRQQPNSSTIGSSRATGTDSVTKKTVNKNYLPDVYKICDVSRACHSMVIALGPPNDDSVFFDENNEPKSGLNLREDPSSSGGASLTQHKTPDPPLPDSQIKDKWLQQWGERLWTLPEILLCPSEHRVIIHALKSNPNKPEQLSKDAKPEIIARRNFASRAYKDTDQAKRIASPIDHFEGSVVLTPLEFVTTALESLLHLNTNQFNKKKEKPWWKGGDQAYALMGLLRRRPDANLEDDDFEAFARLSLANDSDQLLERLICILPKSRKQEWNALDDAWDRPLWDIVPQCQVAGIVDNSTVILDGAFGATIRWDSFTNVAFLKRQTLTRSILKFCFRFAPGFLLIGAVLVGLSPKPGVEHIVIPNIQTISIKIPITPEIVFGGLFLGLGLLIILASPYLLLNLYWGKFWSTQAWFFGIEGYTPIGEIEERLFGHNHHRLKWSINGSTLSKHKSNEFGECVPIPPIRTGKGAEADVQALIEEQEVRGGTERLFMIVCTYTMTATLFWAERPPVAVLVCGREGGMQRAVLCSYDWKTQTYVRETVVRMKTMVLERMFRVDRFRFSLSRPRSGTGLPRQVGQSQTTGLAQTISAGEIQVGNLPPNTG